MDFNNREGVLKLRRVLLVIGIIWLIGMSVLVFMEMFTSLAILAGLLLLAALVVALFNFQYVRIIVAKNKVIVRYYSIFSVERMFQMFEFQADQLRNIEVHKYFLGLKWDIRFTVRVRNGLADYPWVSLSAVPLLKRLEIIGELQKLLHQKN